MDYEIGNIINIKNSSELLEVIDYAPSHIWYFHEPSNSVMQVYDFEHDAYFKAKIIGIEENGSLKVELIDYRALVDDTEKIDKEKKRIRDYRVIRGFTAGVDNWVDSVYQKNIDKRLYDTFTDGDRIVEPEKKEKIIHTINTDEIITEPGVGGGKKMRKSKKRKRSSRNRRSKRRR